MPSNRAAFGRLAACLCLGLLLTLLLCACHRSETSARSAGSDPAPAPNGRLLVGFDADFPPFSFVDDEGRQAGFDYELAGAVCAAQGWEFVPVFMSWDEKDDLLDSGQIDCIWSCFSITSRENDYAWSVPYLDNQFVVVTRDALPIRRLADLAGRRVCVQSSTSLANILVGEYAGLTATFSELCLMDDNETAASAGRWGAPASAVLQAQAAAPGLLKTRPDCSGVSAKSIVMPSSSRRLSAFRNRRSPPTAHSLSPGAGLASTLNSDE